MAIITARGFGYRHASRKNPAFSDLDFTVDRGEKLLLLGASGSGKSTLLAAIAGVLGSDDGDFSGELTVSGVVGMVLQDPDSQVIASRVGDDVAFGCENLGVSREETWRRVRRGLELVGLDLPLDHPTAELSGGQKQRLALAGVLAMGADIIVLDEPTANLDPAGVQEVVRAVTRVASETGATVIIVEHRVATWQGVVDRCMVLGERQLLVDAPIGRIIADYGDSLARAGIWMPGHDPVFEPGGHTAGSGESAIDLHDVVTGWRQPLPGMVPITWSIPRGASTVITGPNGVGKSTLLLSMCGLLPTHAGTVGVHPDIAAGLGGDPYKWRSRDLARRMGYVFQDPEHQFVARTVLEELLVSTKVLGLPEGTVRQRAGEILAQLRLEQLAEANPFSLSGGQKRRLSVATMLINTPRVVFLDEPTFGQDRTTFVELVQLLRGLTDDGVTVVSVTHDELFHHAMADHTRAMTRTGSGGEHESSGC